MVRIYTFIIDGRELKVNGKRTAENEIYRYGKEISNVVALLMPKYSDKWGYFSYRFKFRMEKDMTDKK